MNASVFWVGPEAEKQALVQDDTTPFFTTARRAADWLKAHPPT